MSVVQQGVGGSWHVSIDPAYSRKEDSFFPVSYVGRIEVKQAQGPVSDVPEDLKQELGILETVPEPIPMYYCEDSKNACEEQGRITARHMFSVNAALRHLDTKARQLQFKKSRNGDFVLCIEGDNEVQRRIAELEKREADVQRQEEALRVREETLKTDETSLDRIKESLYAGFGEFINTSLDPGSKRPRENASG